MIKRACDDNQNSFLNLNTCSAHKVDEPNQAEDELICKRDNVREKETKEEAKLDVKQISKIMTEAIIDLDKVLVKEMKKKKDFSGTTALVAINLIKENILVVANVGDSRAVLCDAKGNVIQLSFDHKPEQVCYFN